MPLAREQPGSRIKPDPPRARQIDLGPCVQVREIHLRPARAVEAFHIRLELDQVPGNKARRQPHAAQHVDQHPCGVAAGAGALLQCFLRRLHARLHPDPIIDRFLRGGVQLHEHVDGAAFFLSEKVDAMVHPLPRILHLQVGRELVGHFRIVAERIVLSRLLQEEIEGIVNRHLDDEIHLHIQPRHRPVENHPRKIISLRILLPVDEMPAGADLQRVGQDPRLRVGRRAEPHDMRPVFDGAVVLIARSVVQRDVDGHKGGGKGFSRSPQ